MGPTLGPSHLGNGLGPLFYKLFVINFVVVLTFSPPKNID